MYENKDYCNHVVDINERINDIKEIFKNLSKFPGFICILCLEEEGSGKKTCDCNLFYNPSKNIIWCKKCDSKNFLLRKQLCTPKGLVNLGNTCYMNSVMQIFLNLHEFNSAINDSHLKKDCVVENCMVCSYKALSAEYEFSSLKESISPHNFKKSIGNKNPFFGNYKQHDALELFLTICNGLHEDLTANKKNKKRKKRSIKDIPSSIIDDFFRGKLKYITTCMKCKISNENIEVFYNLSMPVNFNSVDQIIDDYFKKETLKENKICENCKIETKHERMTEILEHPKILCAHIKLFKVTLGFSHKIISEIDFKEKIEISNKKYKLYGVIEHSGMLSFGHYTSCVNLEDSWYNCNDSYTRKISRETLLSSTPYIFFYKLL